MVRAGGDVGVKLAEPRERALAEEEHEGDGRAASIWAVHVRGVGVAVKAKSGAAGAGGVGGVNQAQILRSCKVAKETLERCDVGLPWVGHELAELVDDENDIWPSPHSDEHTQGGKPTRIRHRSRIGLRHLRAVGLGPHEASYTWSRRRTAVFHAGTNQKIHDTLVLGQGDHRKIRALLDIHAEEHLDSSFVRKGENGANCGHEFVPLGVVGDHS